MKYINLFILYCTYFNGIRTQWIDPHDMDIPTTQLIEKNQLKSVEIQCNKNTEYDCLSNLYLKRLIQLLLTNSQLDEMGEVLSGSLRLNMNAQDYNYLNEFVNNKKGSILMEDLQRMNQIFEYALEKGFNEKMMDLLTILSNAIHSLCNVHTLIALLTLLALYKLWQSNFTLRIALVFTFMYLYIIDFILTYYHLEEVERNNIMIEMKKYGSVPPECNPENMSWSTYISQQFYSIFTKNDCAKYYSTVNTNWLFMVTPLKVILHQSKMVFGGIGSAWGAFVSSLNSELPMILNIVLLPALLLCSVFLVCVFLAFITGTQIKFSIPIASLQFNPWQSSQLPSRNRQYIQDVNIDTQNIPKNNKHNINSVKKLKSSRDKQKLSTIRRSKSDSRLYKTND